MLIVFCPAKMKILMLTKEAGQTDKKKKKKKKNPRKSLTERKHRKEDKKVAGGNLLFSGVRTSYTPSQIPALEDMKIKSVNKGISTFFMAIDEVGQVYSWGSNGAGQLGLGDSVDRVDPQRIEEMMDIVEISTGKAHALFLTNSGKVLASGSNLFGQCGQGRETVTQVTPKLVVHGGGAIVRVACGAEFSVLLDAEGRLWTFGQSENGCLGQKQEGRLSRKVSR